MGGTHSNDVGPMHAMEIIDKYNAESIFKTLKYRPGYPRKGLATIEDAREWVLGFARWYNKEHHHSGLNFLSPEQRHSGQLEAVLANRKEGAFL